MKRYSEDELRSWLDDQLPTAAAAELEAHLSTCTTCANAVESIFSVDLPKALMVREEVARASTEQEVLREVHATILFEDLLRFSIGGLTLFLRTSLVPVAVMVIKVWSDSNNPQKDKDS